ncbi:hypothetical protein TIFTF001_050639 [Ficus carica]|uniref:Uncharacterized protein n=1 Tax=Ficus carica TaxID=3494 RepID=A0AA87ZNZ0_FICCA|nr:hypothetical protein TIFTF001_050639 [Ficus carica]
MGLISRAELELGWQLDLRPGLDHAGWAGNQICWPELVHVDGATGCARKK